MKRFQTLRDITITVALLTIPFLFLQVHIEDPDSGSVIDRIAMRASAPLQLAATASADAISEFIGRYSHLLDAKSENDKLRRDNAWLTQRVRELQGEVARVKELEQLLGLREKLPTEAITARVIAKPISPSFRVLRVVVEHGKLREVKPGQPVVSSSGLVGQVRRVSGRFADVLLAVDEDSRVDVIIRRTGARGRLLGLGAKSRYGAQIQFDRPEDDVRVGDQVYTSGLGRKFPAAILVGYVSQVGRKEFGLYQVGEVAPSVDMSRLREVLILQNNAESIPRSNLEFTTEN